MKRKLAALVLCIAFAAGLTAPASAAFSITSIRQNGYYYYQSYIPRYYCQPAKPSTPATPTVPTTPTTPQTPEVTVPETPQNPSAIVLTAFEARVVELVNQVRAQNGLAALTVDAELTKIARLKSQDMMEKRYFDHQSPTYGSPFDMLSRFGVSYRYAGENIAMGYRTAELVMNGWMNSPGHKANILKAAFTHIGVGHVENGNYWTQLFKS